jgi:hypothetical protein
MRLRQIHLAVGILALIAFVLTGQYMHWKLDHLKGLPDLSRLLYRSAHIYLMFSGLCNLLAGLYCPDSGMPSARRIRLAGSAALLASPVLFLLSFFSEIALGVERPLLRWGIYASFAGVLLHAVSSWVMRRSPHT